MDAENRNEIVKLGGVKPKGDKGGSNDDILEEVRRKQERIDALKDCRDSRHTKWDGRECPSEMTYTCL